MMSTYFSAPLSLPTASVPAFIALAGPEESAREGLSGEAQLGLDKVFEADGALSGQAQMLLAPIREDSTPLTQFALSPRYASSGVRRQCAFIAPGQSTILSSLKEPETTQVYLAETHDVPQIVAEFSTFPSLKNRFDGPKLVPIEFIDAANSGDAVAAHDILLGELEKSKKRSSFTRFVREKNWEYAVWTSWMRSSQGYHVHRSYTVLSVPWAAYVVSARTLPESYLTQPSNAHDLAQPSGPVGDLEKCTRTELWSQLARFFAV